MTPPRQYEVVAAGKRKRFDTLEEAEECANAIWGREGVIVGITEVASRPSKCRFLIRWWDSVMGVVSYKSESAARQAAEKLQGIQQDSHYITRLPYTIEKQCNPKNGGVRL